MRGTLVCLLRVLGLLIVEVIASVAQSVPTPFAVRAGMKKLLRGDRKKLKQTQTKEACSLVFKAQEHRRKNEGKKGQDSNRETYELSSMAQV